MDNFFNNTFNPTDWNWSNLFSSNSAVNSPYNVYANENAMRGFGANGGIDMPSVGTVSSNINDPGRIAYANGMGNNGWGLDSIGTWGNLIGGIGQGIAAIGNIWAANKGLDLANKQFNFQKRLAMENLNSAYKQYNTKLGDVARTRSLMETGSEGAYDNWKKENILSRSEI